jgi:PAS domain-containing protein
MSSHQPLELILARNLLSSLSTPAFLVGELGMLLYFNDAAAAMLGRRFEESGRMAAADWTSEFGPFGSNDKPLTYEEMPATIAVRNNKPFHGEFRICTARGHENVAASAIPIVGTGGSTGAIVIFWPVKNDEQGERE